MSTPKDGATLFEEVGKEPTLDALMMRDSRDLTREDYAALVRLLRQERAFNIAASERSPADTGARDE